MNRWLGFGAVAALVVMVAGLGAERIHESRRAARPAPPPAYPMIARVATLEVGGMICGDCVSKIDHELSKVKGVAAVDVSLTGQRAVVVCDAAVPDTALTAAVRRAGPGYLGLIVHR